jgi:hypothetical protein
MDSTMRARSGPAAHPNSDDTKLPGTLPVEDPFFEGPDADSGINGGDLLPGTVPVEKQFFEDGIKLPGTVGVHG